MDLAYLPGPTQEKLTWGWYARSGPSRPIRGYLGLSSIHITKRQYAVELFWPLALRRIPPDTPSELGVYSI
jgi:hypothetical protein